MEINRLDNPTANAVARPESPPAPVPRSEANVGSDPTPAPAPRRSGTLIAAANQALTQLGLDGGSSSLAGAGMATTANRSANGSESSPDRQLDAARQELLHALTHTLASAGRGSPAGGTEPQGNRELDATPSRTPNESSAYGGLVSRLESLVQAMNNGSAAELTGFDQIDTAFRTLAQSSQHAGASGDGNRPDLQALLRTMVQNLQSSGDPTLASTGNIINTTA